MPSPGRTGVPRDAASEKRATGPVGVAAAPAPHPTVGARTAQGRYGPDLLHLQRVVGNRAARDLLAPAPPAPTVTSASAITIRRYLDEDGKLPAEEQTFEQWIEVWWANGDWISQAHRDEVEDLYDKLFAAHESTDADAAEDASAAYDAAYYQWQAYYLEPGSDAWGQAVADALDTLGTDGPAAEEDAAATWPGLDADHPHPEYTKAVRDEVSRRITAKELAAKDAAERERQRKAAEAKALRERQTQRKWTAKEIVKMCGYGGRTSVHPFWGGRNLMINNRSGHHFTMFQDNYDSSEVFGKGTEIDDVITAVFGGKGGENCLHVTQEMFGEKAKENPRYFLSNVHRPATLKEKQVKEFGKEKLKQLMTDERSRIAMLLRSSSTM